MSHTVPNEESPLLPRTRKQTFLYQVPYFAVCWVELSAHQGDWLMELSPSHIHLPGICHIQNLVRSPLFCPEHRIKSLCISSHALQCTGWFPSIKLEYISSFSLFFCGYIRQLRPFFCHSISLSLSLSLSSQYHSQSLYILQSIFPPLPAEALLHHTRTVHRQNLSKHLRFSTASLQDSRSFLSTSNTNNALPTKDFGAGRHSHLIMCPNAHRSHPKLLQREYLLHGGIL